jgi:hypothetical protein|tara:strand:+ start:216 stop:458 length:243 start_codon:yes stop_codon:yes gene_type:complete
MDNPITTMTIACQHCKAEQTFSAPAVNFLAWENGQAHIQNALPMLTPSEREMLTSQTCGDCWIEIFGEPEDDFQTSWINN